MVALACWVGKMTVQSVQVDAAELTHLSNLDVLWARRDPDDLLSNVVSSNCLSAGLCKRKLTGREALILVVRAVLVATVPNDGELGLDHARLDLCNANVRVYQLAQEDARDRVDGALRRAVDGAWFQVRCTVLGAAYLPRMARCPRRYRH